jgi:hypothetical protein
MAIKEVRFRRGVPNRGIEADKAYQCLEKIRRRNNGNLTDTKILEEAKKKTSPIHNWFEWDDTEAAKAHRLSQARNLVRSFIVVYEEAPKIETRAYQVTHRKVAQNDKAKRSLYSTTEEILADPVRRDALIARAIREAMDFRRRFQGIYELDKIFNAIDRTLEDLGKEKKELTRA